MTVNAPAILREARSRSRLSQADVARRAGVAQSVVSSYETGRREPSVQTLARLVAATGHELVLSLVAPHPVRGLPDTPLGRRLRHRRKAVIAAATARRVHNVRVFGSVARGEDTHGSDIDLLVDVGDGVGLFGVIGLERELADLLGTPVDVVAADTLKPRMRQRVLDESITL